LSVVKVVAVIGNPVENSPGILFEAQLQMLDAEKTILWVKGAPNLAVFAAAFCSLHTHARQRSNSGSLAVPAVRRLIGTFYLLAPKLVFRNSELDKSTTA
jgi:hypothetical protein